MGILGDALGQIGNAFRNIGNLPVDALGPGEFFAVCNDVYERADVEWALREAGIKASVYYSEGNIGVRTSDADKALRALSKLKRR